MLHELALNTTENSYNNKLATITYDDITNRWQVITEKDAPVDLLPAILQILVRKGIYVLSPEWSLRFIQDRIVPAERQNIGQILRVVGIMEYDEYALLMYLSGRCCQDECYVTEIK